MALPESRLLRDRTHAQHSARHAPEIVDQEKEDMFWRGIRRGDAWRSGEGKRGGRQDGNATCTQRGVATTQHVATLARSVSHSVSGSKRGCQFFF